MNFIEEKSENYHQVFYFYGEIDSSNSMKYKKEIISLIDNKKSNIIVFDFSNTTFIDSAGIGLILGRYNELRSIGKNLRIRGINTQIDKIFKISGLYQILNIDIDERRVKI